MSARELAFHVLVETETTGSFADSLLGRELDRTELAGADRALATLLVYGTLARQLTLDHTLAGLSSRALAKIEPSVLVLLRMGLFQIAFLDRVPAYAAVDTSVRLARRHARGAAGFVNAVLRRATRDGLRSSEGESERERASIELSHPRWLVDLWFEELGAADARALMEANNLAAPTVLRALTARGQALAVLADRGVEARPAALAPHGIVVAGGDGLGAAAGVATPQGEASQLAVVFAGVAEGARVLDACAAPGGKTAYMASQCGGTGSVTAVDPGRGARRRIEAALERAAARGGAAAPVEIVESGIEELAVGQPFDLVFVDAPCSGLGTLRQHPEIRWRRRPGDVDDLAQRQRTILDRAAEHVRPGGHLVYATCTLVAVENDRLVDAFLATRPDFVEAPPAADSAARSVVGEDGRLRTFPHRHDTDGFFAARLQRRER